VGETGRVVATDLDTRFLDALEHHNLEVRGHDIVKEALEPETYDLVHVRLLLMHLGEGREAALAHMVEALKPGGWLLAEEQDNVTSGQTYPPDELQSRVGSAMRQVAEQTGVDQQCGRKLPMLLEQAGLRDVGADGRTALLKQGTEQMKAGTLFFKFQRDRMAETGLVGTEEVDTLLDSRSTPGPLRMMSPLIVAAWGRKPL
jgi:SAM-dependent methyltransferase